MANLREIKNRLKSTKNTAKVTKAMEMVSAAKSKAASREAYLMTEYSNKINEIVNKLGNSQKNIIYNTKIGIITIGPTKGFVGQLKNVLSNELMQFKSLHNDFQIEGISINKYGKKINFTSGIETKYSFENSNNLWSIMSLLLEKYNSNAYSEMYIAYSKFINLLKSEAVVEKIWPISNTNNIIDDSFLFEPNSEEVLKNLYEKLLEVKLMSAISNSNASEQSARMMTMKNASDNAIGLIETLTKSMNRERQNKITQSIIEVASGGKNYES